MVQSKESSISLIDEAICDGVSKDLRKRLLRIALYALQIVL